MGGAYSSPVQMRNKVYEGLVESIPDQTGKVIAITGCTTGTGNVLAKTTLRKNGAVIMLNRPSVRASTAFESLKAEFPNAKVYHVDCDLSSFASVREAAKEVNKIAKSGLHVLCNNAGVMANADEATGDGYDIQMQTNHLSHFLLTNELMPLLNKAASQSGDARVIQMSSISAFQPATPLDERYYGKNGGNLGGNAAGAMFNGPRWERYHQTKLANMIFNAALAGKLSAADSRVRAIVAHPGVASTNMQVTSAGHGGIGSFLAKLLFKVGGQSGEDGAAGIIRASFDPSVANGAYLGPKDRKGKPSMDGPAVEIEIPALAAREGDRDTLWRLSEEATGGEFRV
mmetsp:Transcript_30310/g.52367  ORF Transcript_30310/g.52367 Transcript_30310/m.52367 type:complete len:343 (+) Transcript_30310:120-1148(+)